MMPTHSVSSSSRRSHILLISLLVALSTQLSFCVLVNVTWMILSSGKVTSKFSKCRGILAVIVMVLAVLSQSELEQSVQ